MGMLIERGYGWRALFPVRGDVAGVMLIASLAVVARVPAPELGPRASKAEPAQPVCRRRVAACQCRRAAAAAVAAAGRFSWFVCCRSPAR